MNRLWTAIVEGATRVGIVDKYGLFVYWTENGSTYSVSESNFTDLTEVRIVPITAQVVEEGDVVLRGVSGFTVEEIISGAIGAVHQTGFTGVELRLQELLAQLTPSAEPEVIVEKWISGQDGSGGATTQEGGEHPKDCYGCKDEVDRKWREDHKPTPTVTIGLTEEELAHFEKFAIFDNGMFNYEDHGKFYLIKEKIRSQLNPRMEEPKVREVVVAYWRLGEGGEDSVDEFMRYTCEPSIEDQYISINHGDKAKWSDLLNPEKVGL